MSTTMKQVSDTQQTYTTPNNVVYIFYFVVILLLSVLIGILISLIIDNNKRNNEIIRRFQNIEEQQQSLFELTNGEIDTKQREDLLSMKLVIYSTFMVVGAALVYDFYRDVYKK